MRPSKNNIENKERFLLTTPFVGNCGVAMLAKSKSTIGRKVREDATHEAALKQKEIGELNCSWLSLQGRDAK